MSVMYEKLRLCVYLIKKGEKACSHYECPQCPMYQFDHCNDQDIHAALDLVNKILDEMGETNE